MAVRKQDAPGNQPVDAPLPDLIPPVEPDEQESIERADPEPGYHDSISGRAVHADGRFVEPIDDEGPVEAHRIVANDWPERQGR